MKLFIGNVTKQYMIFSYRVPERKQLCTQQIPPGGIVAIAPGGIGGNTDLAPEDIRAILEQHAIYGIRDANDFDKSSDYPFSGVIYSEGKTISPEKMRRAAERIDKQLDKLGKQIRQEAAVAAHDSIEKQFMGGEPMQKPLDVSIAEEIPSRGLDDSLTHIAEGIRITRNLTSDMPVANVSRR